MTTDEDRVLREFWREIKSSEADVGVFSMFGITAASTSQKVSDTMNTALLG